ncbi:glycosyltransferase family 2 protein [Myroides odoratimimus]|uniref:glycosyltransferase family 2 protein n=1 Tax=Myroides odoratimimus TaxID=76832 RepID=UPI002574D072|nr:glycosyltransferase family 2 protein [Myroides odoratimimus]MDM1500023.1 glycosyltransferase family 2 protein [Myroides odoratimimus]
MNLSVIIPTYNEEKYIADAIKSVDFADQIIVLDSYSNDKTIQIATDMGCLVLQNKFVNFSTQKNFAIPYAKGKWILFIDADERVTDSLRKEILEVIKNPGEHKAFKLRFPHFFINEFLFHKADKVTRLVYNEGVHFTGEVHEKLHTTEGKTGILKNHVVHLTYKGIFHYMSKKESYSWFQASEQFKKKKKVSYYHLAFKPFYRFFHIYFIKRGYLDKTAGLAGATLDAYGVFARYLKLMLLQKGLK